MNHRPWTRAWARADAALVATAVALEPLRFRTTQLTTYDLVYRRGLELVAAAEVLGGIRYDIMRNRVRSLRRQAAQVLERRRAWGTA